MSKIQKKNISAIQKGKLNLRMFKIIKVNNGRRQTQSHSVCKRSQARIDQKIARIFAWYVNGERGETVEDG